MKRALIADIHYKKFKNNPFRLDDISKTIDTIIDICKDHKCYNVDILGDYWSERKSIDILVWLAGNKGITKLADGFDTVSIIPGNHDIYYKHNSTVNSVAPFENLGNITVYNEPTLRNIDKMSMLYVPFCSDEEQVINVVKEYSDNKNLVALIHQPAIGTTANNGFEITHGISHKKILKYCDKVFAGDIHKHQVLRSQKKEFIYVGAPTQITFSDVLYDPGFIIFDTTSLSWEFIKIPQVREFVVVDYDRFVKEDIEDNIVKITFPSTSQWHKSNIDYKIEDIKNKYNPKYIEYSLECSDEDNSTAKTIKNITFVDAVKQYIKEHPLKDNINKKDLMSVLREVTSTADITEKNFTSKIGKLQKVVIDNFFSVEGRCEINLKDRGLVLLNGINKDKFSSNGSGKTTLINSIVYGCFGCVTNKNPKPKMDKLACRLNKKPMLVEHYYDSGYIIRRGRRPKVLQLLNPQGQDISRKDDSETQKMINDLLGMDRDVFSKTSIFDKYAISFLMTGSEAEKKQFIERIFNIQSRDEYLDIVKKIEKRYINEIEVLNSNSNILEQNKEVHKSKIDFLIGKEKSFDNDKKNKVAALQKEIDSLKEKQAILTKIDTDKILKKIKRNDAVTSFCSTMSNVVLKNKAKANKIQYIADDYELYKNINIEEIKNDIIYNKKHIINIGKLCRAEDITHAQIENIKDEIQKLKNSAVDEICSLCGQDIIDSEKHNKQIIQRVLKEDKKLNRKYKLLEKIIQKKNDIDNKIIKIEHEHIIDKIEQIQLKKDIVSEYKSLLKNVNLIEKIKEVIFSIVEDVKYSKDEIQKLQESKKIRQNKIDTYKKQISEVIESKNIYTELVVSEKAELVTLCDEVLAVRGNIRQKQNKLSCCLYWKNAFGKSGIKNIMIHNAIAMINDVINKYVTIFDGDKVFFDDNMNEIISEYATQSSGERQRTNLSFLFSSFEICVMNSSIGVLSLDECFDGLDISGFKSVISALNHLSQKAGTILFVSHHDIFNKDEIVENGKVIPNTILDSFDSKITAVKNKSKTKFIQ